MFNKDKVRARIELTYTQAYTTIHTNVTHEVNKAAKSKKEGLFTFLIIASLSNYSFLII